MNSGILSNATRYHGLYVWFVLCTRSRQEHQDLQFSQFHLTSKNGIKCLRYTENGSKNNPGGIKHHKIQPKIVEHYESSSNPDRCIIKLYENYIHHCPPKLSIKTDAFYPMLLKKQR